MTLNLKVLDEGEIEQIRATALRVLHKKGLRFTVPEIRSIFKSYGFTITDSDIVHITPDDLDAALKTAPRLFTRRGASPSKDVQIGKGPTKYAIGSVPIWVIERDPEIIRRPATYSDFKNFTLLFNQSQNEFF